MIIKQLSIIFILLLGPLLPLAVFGQNEDLESDTVIVSESGIRAGSRDTLTIEINDRYRPVRAAFYSVALPGLGQIYNERYWKVPILYGGAVVIGYYIKYNHNLYIESRDGLVAERDGDSRTNNIGKPIQRFDATDLERRMSFYRRNRDYLIMITILVYGLNIVDAHVDAHLRDFKISEDLTLNFKPAIMNTHAGTLAAGMTLTLNIGK
ncbi:MAG: DUF5683 domain-containing protein [Cyclobacteriaceae bacterium]